MPGGAGRWNLQHYVIFCRRLKLFIHSFWVGSKHTFVSEHFLSNFKHFNSNMQTIPLEIIYSSRDSILKTRDACHIF